MGFIDCESLSVKYNNMGIATITFSFIGTESELFPTNISAGGQSFDCIVTNFYKKPIPNTENSDQGTWYTTDVTMIATS